MSPGEPGRFKGIAWFVIPIFLIGGYFLLYVTLFERGAIIYDGSGRIQFRSAPRWTVHYGIGKDGFTSQKLGSPSMWNYFFLPAEKLFYQFSGSATP